MAIKRSDLAGGDDVANNMPGVVSDPMPVLMEKLRPWELRCHEAMRAKGLLMDAFQTRDRSIRGIYRAVRVPLANLRPNPWNPNGMDSFSKQALDQSLATNGQFYSVIVRPHPEEDGLFQIGDGEHRYSLMNGDVFCNVMLGYSSDEFRKLGLMGNHHGRNNQSKLAALLDGLDTRMARHDLEYAMPIQGADLDNLLEIARIDRAQQERGSSEPKDSDRDADSTEESGDVWEVFEVKVPGDMMPVLLRAFTAVEEERILNGDRAIAWGQVLESLSADYLAGYVARSHARLLPETQVAS